MPKPLPESVEPAELRALALQVIEQDKFPVLASVDDDQPCIRPVSPLRNDDFVIWIASLASSQKTGEIEANPKVELCYMNEQHDQVRITGIAHTITDVDVKKARWDESPLLQQFLPDVNDPEFVLYRVEPTRVRYMKEWALAYFEVPINK